MPERPNPDSPSHRSVRAAEAARCHACGSGVLDQAVVCPTCGAVQQHALAPLSSDKRIAPALTLCLVLGVFGAHRFYAGRTGTAILQLVTLGGLGIWTLVDAVMLATGSFIDGDGDRIEEWV